jgi:CheY-like chemotaxis protein
MYDELPVRHNDVPAEHDMAAHLPGTPLRARHRHQQSRRRDAGAQRGAWQDGWPALQQLRACREPMVVLLDMEMPRMDGVAVLQEVAADPVLSTKHAFVVVTANASALPPAFSALLRRLQVPVVPKPFDLDELFTVVSQAMQRVTTA